MSRGQQLLYLIKSIKQGKELNAVIQVNETLTKELTETKMALEVATIERNTFQEELNALHAIIAEINGEEVTNE